MLAQTDICSSPFHVFSSLLPLLCWLINCAAVNWLALLLGRKVQWFVSQCGFFCLFSFFFAGFAYVSLCVFSGHSFPPITGKHARVNIQTRTLDRSTDSRSGTGPLVLHAGCPLILGDGTLSLYNVTNEVSCSGAYSDSLLVTTYTRPYGCFMLNAAIAGAAGVDQENRIVKETLPYFLFFFDAFNEKILQLNGQYCTSTNKIWLDWLFMSDLHLNENHDLFMHQPDFIQLCI